MAKKKPTNDEIVVVGARVEISRESIEACHRLVCEKNHYPGLLFSGDVDSYKKFRADVELVVETLAMMLGEISKSIHQGGQYEN